MTREKIKIPSKKSNISPNVEFETFLKNQQNIVARLKTELKSVVSKSQLSDCETAEKDKCILELEHSINQREAKIHKLNTNLDQLKEENSKILMEFNFFKEKFCQLEIDYDRTLNQNRQENENLLEQLRQQQTTENQEIQELSLKCLDLQQRLKDTINDLTQLNKRHVETLQNLEQMKSNFEQQRKEFELYQKQVNEDKRLNDEKNKLDFENLRDELRKKDETLNQCISDKNMLEKDKNLIIDELNNKILRIERAFSQPTKVVQPMVTLPEQVNNLDNNSNSESSNNNMAISKPQVRKPLENLSVEHFSSNENKNVEQNQTQRSSKFKRPVLPQTSSQQSNVVTNTATNRKRRNQPLRQPLAVKSYNEFSLSSSDDDDDNDSNYNSFAQQLWRPNNECYVADTDTSEGFANAKRAKK